MRKSGNEILQLNKPQCLRDRKNEKNVFNRFYANRIMVGDWTGRHRDNR